MHLVLFGLSMTSSWGNGHATVHRSLLPAMAARGHRITFFEKDVEYYARRRDRTDFPGVEVILYSNWPEVRHHALSLAQAADVLLWTSFCPDGAVIQQDLMGHTRALRVFYDMDTPVTLAGLQTQNEEVLRYLRPDAIAGFDLYLSFTGGPILAQLREVWQARRVAPLYLCADPQQHAPVDGQERFRCRLNFLGTWSADRWEPLQQFFLTPARQLPAARFALAGAMYPRETDWPPNVERWEHLAPEEHSAFYSSADFTLNLTRQAMRQWGYSPQGRIFEAALCATPVITDAWPGLEEFLEPGREVLVAYSADDVVDLLTSMPKQEARRMGLRARQRVLEEHSGERRARELEMLLEGVSAPAA